MHHSFLFRYFISTPNSIKHSPSSFTAASPRRIHYTPLLKLTSPQTIKEFHLLHVPHIHICAHKSPPLLPILNEMNLLHNDTLNIFRPPTQSVGNFSCLTHVLYVPSMTLSLIWSPWWYQQYSTNYESSHCAAFSILLSHLFLLDPNYSPQHPVLKQSSLQSVFSLERGTVFDSTSFNSTKSKHCKTQVKECMWGILL